MECENMKVTTTDQGQAFFATGIEKYLDAKSAVEMFENEVQWRVKDVVKKHELRLKKLFGEEHWVLKDYVESAMPDAMYLGQKVAFKSFGILYFYFSFWRDEDSHSCPSLCATFYRERVTILTPLWATVKEIHPKLDVYNNSTFSMVRPVPASDLASCEKALNAVIGDWIKLWEKLGGLPKYLPKVL